MSIPTFSAQALDNPIRDRPFAHPFRKLAATAAFRIMSLDWTTLRIEILLVLRTVDCVSLKRAIGLTVASVKGLT